MVLSGVVAPSALVHSGELLEEFVRVLKPSGILHLIEPVSNGGKLLIIPALSMASYKIGGSPLYW